jgi:ankyrin repeat protein
LSIEIQQDVARRWEELRAMDALVAAARAGDVRTALALVDSPLVHAQTERSRRALGGVVGLLGCSGRADLLAWALGRLQSAPDLAAVLLGSRRTLLHDAAGAWVVPFVELLLELGADPNAVDTAGHAPLYHAGNRFVKPSARDAEAGGQVVAALARAGADVNAAGGAKRCTALHMAARRGNLKVAEALLDRGADLEARDSLGETPLRRAVNCSQPALARLLVSRGAGVHSRDRRGLTPLQAARTEAMRAALQPHRS